MVVKSLFVEFIKSKMRTLLLIPVILFVSVFVATCGPEIDKSMTYLQWDFGPEYVINYTYIYIGASINFDYGKLYALKLPEGAEKPSAHDITNKGGHANLIDNEIGVIFFAGNEAHTVYDIYIVAVSEYDYIGPVKKTVTTWEAIEEDEYEPDDYYQDASLIEAGETQERTIYPMADIDWMEFHPIYGEDYSITIDSPDEGMGLYLFDPFKNDPIAIGWPGNPVFFKAIRSTYYLAVINIYNFVGKYKLHIDIESIFPSTHIPELCEALDIEEYDVYSSGYAFWFTDTEKYHYDGSSARSGNIAHNQSSSMSFTFTGVGLSFYWKVSSESLYDKLIVKVNGVEKYNISGEVDWTRVIIDDLEYGEHTVTWVYEKDGSVSSGEDCGWVDKVEVYESPPSFPELSEALDIVGYDFHSVGSGPWNVCTEEYHYGGSSARSGNIAHNQSSSMSFTFTGVGLSFYWKVSSESLYDKLIVKVNGVEKYNISGEVDWTRVIIDDLEYGEHTVTWVYEKDGSVSSGEDCGWVDKVEIISE